MNFKIIFYLSVILVYTIGVLSLLGINFLSFGQQ